MNYDAADKAIKAINRENLKIFGRLKTRLMKADELNIIRETGNAYDDSLAIVKRNLLAVAKLAYQEGIREAGKRHKNEIDMEWLLFWMAMTDPVTLYKFLPEWRRKRARLIEALPVAQSRVQEIDRALRSLTRQIGQAAIGVTDAATIEAFEDAGVEYVQWHTQRDEKVCEDCEPLDGKVFRIDEIPTKHWNCRCYWTPVTKPISGE